MKLLILLGLIFELEVLHMFVLVKVGSLSVASLLMVAAVCTVCSVPLVSSVLLNAKSRLQVSLGFI